jgi:hypothetical protein
MIAVEFVMGRNQGSEDEMDDDQWGIFETRALRTVNANKMELLTCGTWIRWQNNKVE